jgi:hypothetical protein
MLLHTVSLIFSLCLLSFDVASATSESRLPVVRPLTIGGRSNSYTHRHHLQKRQPENWDDLPKVQYVELPVDHFGNGNGTFKNRYWVYDAAYKPGGPIFSTNSPSHFEIFN